MDNSQEGKLAEGKIEAIELCNGLLTEYLFNLFNLIYNLFNLLIYCLRHLTFFVHFGVQIYLIFLLW